MKTKLLKETLLNLICLVFCLQATGQNVNDRFTVNDIEYIVSAVGTPNEVRTYSYLGTNTMVAIPATVTYSGINYSVTAIGGNCFSNKLLTSVTIPNSITSIGTHAFINNSLTSIIIPNSITEIGSNAFRNNSLTSITIPNSVTSIGSRAFMNNSLTSVTIPSSVTSIEYDAFQNNSLTAVISESSNPANLLANVFDDNSAIDLTIPTGTTATYTTALWTGFNSVTESSTLSINDIEVLNELKVIATTNTLKVVSTNTIKNLQVYALTGAKVAFGASAEISIRHLATGIYIAHIQTDKGIATKKFIKK